MWLVPFCLLLTGLPSIWGVCDQQLVTDIAKKLWNNQLPSKEEILANISGKMTQLNIPGFLDEDSVESYKCTQSFVEGSLPDVQGRDVHYFSDEEKPLEEPYKVTLDAGLIRKVYNKGKPEEVVVQLYVAVLKDDMVGFYQCMDHCRPEQHDNCGEMGFLAVAARHYRGDQHQRTAAEAVRTTMKEKLGKDFSTWSPLDCPDITKQTVVDIKIGK